MPDVTDSSRDAVAPPGATAGDRHGRLVALPRGPGRPLGNLPVELTSFIGREREVAEVEKLLAENRLLTLTGPGGCGKTRLALEVAQDLAQRFEDGAWWVGLASLSDPDLVPQVVASTLDVREAPGRSLNETLVGHLESKKMLLVLDNCEHLVEGCAVLAATLLPSCPNLRILATGREALNLVAERAWLAPSLSLPGDVVPRRLPPVEELVNYEAVRLFSERAEAVSGFALTEGNASAVARVCQRLDGIPLAIELAAARTKVLSVEQIAGRLDDAFRLLTGGSRTALPRQRTLRATMDWSHELLSEEERALFRRLSVFAGGFALGAAEEVCSGEDLEEDEVLELLSRLVDKSLVVAREEGGEMRYRLLETVRQYGREKLEASDEAQNIRRSHALFFLKLAEEAEPAMLGPQQTTWMGRLEREHDNLRAALGWLRQEGALERRLRLAGALGRFWWFRGYFTEGRAWLEKPLQLAEASGRTAVRAKALHSLGVLIHRSADYAAGDQELARSRLQESIDIYRELGDGPRTAVVLWSLGRLSIEAGDWETASSSLEESLELERRSGNERGIAQARTSLGVLALFRGEHGPALAHLEESLRVLQSLGSTEDTTRCLLFLGHLACDQGDYAAARARFTKVVENVSLERYRYVAPFVLETYARLTAGEGQTARALRLMGAADALWQTLGSPFPPAFRAYLRRDFEQARQALDEEEGAVAWEEGRAMTLEEAITHALDEPPLTEPAPPPEGGRAPAGTRDVPKLRIFALGPTRVYRGEHALAPSEWTYAKSRELLFYLLSHPSRTKEQIGLALWPNASPSQFRSNFHRTVHYLRRALGRPEWISFEKGHYSFNRSLPYFFDVEAFEKKLDEARRPGAGAPERAVRLLKEAIDLYKGDFLGEMAVAEGEWVLQRQEELKRLYGEALLDLGGLLSEEGRYAEAAEVYRKAIIHDELLEAAHRELMRCHARLGERNQALRHYQTLVGSLREELGSSPAPETAELHRSLLRGEDV